LKYISQNANSTFPETRTGWACYGFNGKEKDDEWSSVTGAALDYGARIYDSRLCRWSSVDIDQKKYPSFSSYNFCVNNPLIFVDPNGKGVEITTDKEGNTSVKSTVYIYSQTDAAGDQQKICDALGFPKGATTGNILQITTDEKSKKTITYSVDIIVVSKDKAKTEAAKLGSKVTSTNFLAVADDIGGGANERDYQQNVGAITWERLQDKTKSDLKTCDNNPSIVAENVYGKTKAEKTILHFTLHTGGFKDHLEITTVGQTEYNGQKVCYDKVPILYPSTSYSNEISKEDINATKTSGSPSQDVTGGKIYGTGRKTLMTESEMKNTSKNVDSPK
jgi:RHS repeat-associated protein